MASRIWLLVEWMQYSNMFPSYGVINVKTSAYDPSELHPGSEIYVRIKRSKPQQARIMRVSENKQYVDDHKDLLERQNEQFKTLLKFCMQGFREIKSENNPLNLVKSEADHSRERKATPQVIMASQEDGSSDSESELTSGGNHSRDRKVGPQVIVASQDDRSSDSESESDSNVRYSRNSNRTVAKFSRQNNRKETKVVKVHRCAPWVTSTPLTTRGGQNIILHYHQETQTEGILLYPKVETVENMLNVLNKLYREFLNLCSKINLDCNALENGADESSEETSSDYEHYEYDLLTEHNNSMSSLERITPEGEKAIPVRNAREEDNVTSESDKPLNTLKHVDRDNTNTPKVHKLSTQSNNNLESTSLPMSHDKALAPIGNGFAKVPVRLLHDIDWTSHTTATRHLLQAIFPRSVLATHSLTGKQSPAFMNRPPKKILDPKLVEDIVKIVSTRCNVPKNLVRNTITIKCTDEAKLYRNRQQYKLQRKTNQNDENKPPAIAPCDDTSMN